MLSRHKDELLGRLERVADLGTCEFRGSELRLWYGRERLTKVVWADILERWAEVDGDDGNGLLVGNDADNFTIVFNDGLTPSKDSWWKDLRAWAR